MSCKQCRINESREQFAYQCDLVVLFCREGVMVEILDGLGVVF